MTIFKYESYNEKTMIIITIINRQV